MRLLRQISNQQIRSDHWDTVHCSSTWLMAGHLIHSFISRLKVEKSAHLMYIRYVLFNASRNVWSNGSAHWCENRFSYLAVLIMYTHNTPRYDTRDQSLWSYTIIEEWNEQNPHRRYAYFWQKYLSYLIESTTYNLAGGQRLFGTFVTGMRSALRQCHAQLSAI